MLLGSVSGGDGLVRSAANGATTGSGGSGLVGEASAVHEIVELGELDPETVVTPGIHVQKIVKIPRVATQAGGIKLQAIAA